jgi:hypothetical protein
MRCFIGDEFLAAIGQAKALNLVPATLLAPTRKHGASIVYFGSGLLSGAGLNCEGKPGREQRIRRIPN